MLSKKELSQIQDYMIQVLPQALRQTATLLGLPLPTKPLGIPAGIWGYWLIT